MKKNSLNSDKVNLAYLMEEMGFEDVDRDKSTYLGLCVLHDDRKTKSFSADLEEGVFNCFGCGLKGNAIHLYAAWKGVTYPEACEQLKSGEFLYSSDTTSKPVSNIIEKESISFRLRWQIYKEFLDLQVPVLESNLRDYILKERCLKSDVVEFLQLKAYNPSSVMELLKRYTPAQLYAAGLLVKKDSKEEDSTMNLRGRFDFHPLLIPYLTNNRSIVTYFQGRSFSDYGSRYLNLSGSLPLPYNSDVLLRKQDRVYICEGVFDCLTLLSVGYKSVIAIPGVNALRDIWVKILVQICNEVVVSFDNDLAGQKGFEEVRRLFESRGLKVSQLVLPDGCKDVNEALTKGLLIA